MSYCEGYFKISDTGAAIRNVTGCSNRTVLFNFDPTDVLSGELNDGVNLSDINWSDAIDDDFEVLSTTTKAMAILYCIGTGATGLAVVAGAWLVFTGGRTQAIAELLLSMVSRDSPSTSSIILFRAFYRANMISSCCCSLGSSLSGPRRRSRRSWP